MSVDARINFGLSAIAVGPAPAGSGLALTLEAGGGAQFAAICPFNAVCWPPGVMPIKANAEIVRVESVSGDKIALVGRGQEGTVAQQIEPGWQFADMLTAKTIEDLKALVEAETARAKAAEKAAEEGAITAATSKVKAEEEARKGEVKSEKERAEAAEAAAITTAESVAEAAAKVTSEAEVAGERTRAEAAEAAAILAAEAASAQGFNPTAVKTGGYTAAPGDYVPVDISGGSVAVALPSAPADKARIGLKIVAISGTPGSTTLTINRGGTDVFNVAGGSTSLSLSAKFQGVVMQYKASTGIWYVQTTDTPLNEALGAALLGTDGTIGGPSGSALTSSVVSSSAIYVANVWNYGPEGKRAYALLAGGTGELRDGTGRALSAVYSTLGAAQAKYSFVTSLTQTVDWAANTAAIRAAAEAGGGTVVTPASSHPYIINSPIVQKYNTNYDDLGLAGGFESNGAEVATFKLAKEANCHMVEGDPEAPEGTIAAGFKNQNSSWRVILDGNRFEQTAPVDNFHLVSLASCTFREGTFSRNASGACYHLEKCLEITGKIPAKNGGQHIYFFNDLTDSILDVNGFGCTQGSVLYHEASGGRTCQIRGFVGNCNPPNGTLKETITNAQTAGIVLINNSPSGVPTWGGTVLIGTEQITYTGYTLKGKEVTLTGVTRGANSTAAAEHLAGANWHEYAKYQDGVTYLGTNGRLNRFDLRSDQNWGHNINIPEVGVYDSIFVVQCAQAGFENPEAQDSIVCNAVGITLLGTATFCDQAEAFAVTSNTEIGASAINMTGAKAKGFVNNARVVITALTGSVKGLGVGKLYFVVGAAENSFELSLTEGGAAVKVESHALEASTKMLVSSERLAVQVGASAKACDIQVSATAGGTVGFAWPFPSIGNPDGSALSSANTANYIVDFQNKRVAAFMTEIGEGTDSKSGVNLTKTANVRLEYNAEGGHVGAQVSGSNFAVATAGDGLRVAEGSNCKQGVSGSMVSGKVTVANTAITATSRLLLTRQAGGTNPGAVYESERVAGEKFVVLSTNVLDTGSVAYQIFEPA